MTSARLVSASGRRYEEKGKFGKRIAMREWVGEVIGWTDLEQKRKLVVRKAWGGGGGGGGEKREVSHRALEENRVSGSLFTRVAVEEDAWRGKRQWLERVLFDGCDGSEIF